MRASAQEHECQGGRSQTIELYSQSLGAEVESSAWHHGITLAKLYEYYLKADAQNLQADIESCILSQLGIDDDDWVDSLDVEEQEKFHQDVGKVCKDLQDSFKHTADFLHKEIDLNQIMVLLYYDIIQLITVCNLYKSGDKKTVRREGIEPIGRVFTYGLFSVTHSL